MNCYKYAQLENLKKQRSGQLNAITITSSNAEPSMITTRRVTADAEKQVLNQLLLLDVGKEELDEKTEEALLNLPGWNINRVKQYLRNNKKKYYIK